MIEIPSSNIKNGTTDSSVMPWRKRQVLIAVSENAQQIQKQVDEVEIQTEGPPQSQYAHLIPGIHCSHDLDLLCIVSGKPYENKHADHAEEQIQPGRF